MPERIEADAAEVEGGVVAQRVRDKAVGSLVEGDGDDERQCPDRQVVEGHVHGCPDGSIGAATLSCSHERSEPTVARRQAGTVPGYCGRPSSSFTQSIFSETHICSVGAKALRSSKVASATPATPLRRPNI